jgi:hypothetical protein
MFRRNVTGFGSGIICIEYLLGLRAVTPVEAERTGDQKGRICFRLLVPAIEYAQ